MAEDAMHGRSLMAATMPTIRRGCDDSTLRWTPSRLEEHAALPSVIFVHHLAPTSPIGRSDPALAASPPPVESKPLTL